MSKLVRGNSALIRLWKEIAELRSQMDKRLSNLEKQFWPPVTSKTLTGEDEYKIDHISETTDDKRSQDAENKLMDASIKGQQDFEAGKRWAWEMMNPSCWEWHHKGGRKCHVKVCSIETCPKMKE